MVIFRADDAHPAAAFDALIETLRDGIRMARSAALDDAEAADAYRFFTHQLRAALGMYFDNDPEQPRFSPLCSTALRQPWANSGAPLDILGPVPHAIYDLAPLSGNSSYVLRGTRGTVDFFGVYLYAGGGWTGVLPERVGDSLNHRSLVCAPDGSFAIEIAPSPTGIADNFLELEPDAHSVLVRQFFADPDREEPARYSLERAAPLERAVRITDAEVTRRLQSVTAIIQTNANERLRAYGQIWPLHDGWIANAFVPTHPGHQPFTKGSPAGAYVSPDHRHLFCHYDVGLDDALVMQITPPQADWWAIFAQSRSLQSNVRAPEDRNFVSNGTAASDRDGRVTVVASHRDPGTPNWLDLGGRQRGEILLIWWEDGADPDRSAPTIGTEIRPLAALALPPRVDRPQPTDHRKGGTMAKKKSKKKGKKGKKKK